MKGKPAIYLGRVISKENFRAVVYGTHKQKKIVNSWDEFEAAMASGMWFASIKEVERLVVKPEDQVVIEVKKQSKPRKKSKPLDIEIISEVKGEEISEDLLDDMVYEVTDDFLPTERK